MALKLTSEAKRTLSNVDKQKEQKETTVEVDKLYL